MGREEKQEEKKTDPAWEGAEPKKKKNSLAPPPSRKPATAPQPRGAGPGSQGPARRRRKH